ncbi:MAG TPA: hypothetical protein VEA69_01420 [Tepidisphaeraceae bacterium]|nr:hypothetical protein [Tepidisphaeraceae bacterium]
MADVNWGEYSQAEQDWLRRNQNPDGSYDTHRVKAALGNVTAHRPYDSQTADPQQQAANERADASQRRAASPADTSQGSAVQATVPQNATPAQSWNAAPAQAPVAAPATPAPTDPFPAWYKELMEREIAERQAAQAEAKRRADELYGSLDARAKQGLQVNANDPVIKGQVDAFRSEGERSRRNYISDLAESRGPLANIRGEERMAAERLGQGVGGFQAELLARELGARRDEIAQALQMQGSLLNADQQRGLQAQLAAYDQAIREAGVGLQGRSLDLQGQDLALRGELGRRGLDLGFADLDLRGELGRGGLELQRDLGFAGLDLQRLLGTRGQDLQRRDQDLSMDRFLRELALREWEAGDTSDWRWASL